MYIKIEKTLNGEKKTLYLDEEGYLILNCKAGDFQNSQNFTQELIDSIL